LGFEARESTTNYVLRTPVNPFTRPRLPRWARRRATLAGFTIRPYLVALGRRAPKSSVEKGGQREVWMRFLDPIVDRAGSKEIQQGRLNSPMRGPRVSTR
jgi:hypothetical protein